MDFHLSCAFRLAVVYWFCLEIKFYRLSGAGWRFSLQVVLWGAPAAEHHPQLFIYVRRRAVCLRREVRENPSDYWLPQLNSKQSMNAALQSEL